MVKQGQHKTVDTINSNIYEQNSLFEEPTV